VSDVATNPDVYSGHYAVASNGTLVFLPGRAEAQNRRIAWLTQNGAAAPLSASPGPYYAPAISPDGKRFAYSLRGPSSSDVWLYDIARDTPAILTSAAARVPREVAWTPDGRHIVYAAGNAFWWIRSDGSGQPHRLLEGNGRPTSFTPDGRQLIFMRTTDIWSVTLDMADPERPNAGAPEAIVQGPAVEVDPMLSQDGKWLAYSSNESGQEDIYVRPFPPGSGGGKVRISAEGGKFAFWSRTARELYCVGAGDRVMVVTYAVQGSSFEAGKPRVWSPQPIQRTGVYRPLDLHPDGKRFLIFPRAEEQTGADAGLHVTFILNFFDELKRKVP
jgi:serine/threonine-protein kinase